MKELSIAEKAKAYDEAIERAKRMFSEKELNYLFPELKESEDERIRCCIAMCLTDADEQRFKDYNTTVKDCLDWLEKQSNLMKALQTSNARIGELIEENYYLKERLEKQSDNPAPININKMVMEYSHTKDGDFGLPVNCMIRAYRQGINDALNLSSGIENQGEQKPTDMIEPKFKVGDWVVKNDGNDCFSDGSYALQITAIDGIRYKLSNGFYLIEPFHYTYRVWSIQDARDGDVLCYETKDELRIFIYKNGHIDYHCCYNNGHLTTVDSFFVVEKYLLCYIHPATKEQRDLLLQKMREAGCTWNDEKKELQKIEQKPADKVKPKFKAGDKIHCKLDGRTFVIKEVDLENGDYLYTKNGCGNDIDYADEMFELVEQKDDWNEEDEKIISKINSVLEAQVCWDGATGIKMNPYQDALDWLKSLKPQSLWKPSKEQIDALDEVYKTHGANSACRRVLITLLNDLQKLREE